jgi:polysaccharide deacetylase 2 family uncharacterized protein YibQ
VKTSQKIGRAPGTGPTPKKQKKKLKFEDFVRAALVSAAVICVVVLGIGGYYLARSVYSKENHPSDLSLTAGIAGTPAANPEPLSGAEMPSGGTDTALADAEALAAAEAAELAAAAAASARTAEILAAEAAAQPETETGQKQDLPGGRKGYIALVIDDAGNSLRDLEPFLEFPGPITIAVLPGLPNSVESARRVRAAKKELFLHQPMEPLNGQNPGPSAIVTGMSPAEVKDILMKNLTEIGPVSGFNNHEGSRATSDSAIMRPVLEVSRDGALYFLDSRTTADTVSPQIAKELNIAIAQRNIFLDNEQDRESILAQLESGCKLAEQKGTAIMIGHTWSPRLAAILKEMHPQITKRGLVFVTVGTILYRGK